MVIEGRNNLVEAVFSLRRIQIQPADSRLGDEQLKLLFHPLGAKTLALDMRHPTGRTHLNGGLRMSAVMAMQMNCRFLECQAHIAVYTFRHPAARTTLHERRVSPPVLKQDNLLLPFQGFRYLLQQDAAEIGKHLLLPSLL